MLFLSSPVFLSALHIISSFLLYSYFFHMFICKLCHHVKDCSILVSVTSWRSAWQSWLDTLVVVWCPWRCQHRIPCTSAALPALLSVAGALFCIVNGIKWILSIWMRAKSKIKGAVSEQFLNFWYAANIREYVRVSGTYHEVAFFPSLLCSQ